MKRNKLFAFAAIVLVVLVTFSSCSEVTIKQLKDQSLVQGIGIDLTDDGKYEVTLQVFDVSKSGTSSQELKGSITTTYSSTGKTIAEAIADSQRVLDRETFLAQNKVIVISEEVAKKKLQAVLDYFIRAQNCRPDVQMAMTKETAKKVIKAKCKDAIIPAEKIQKTLINGEYNGKNVNCMVKDVVNSYLHPASDIFLPVVKAVGKDEEENVALDGVAVFSDNKFSGYVDEGGVRSILWANGRIKNGIISLETEKFGKVSFKITSSKTRKKVEVENGKITYFLDLKVRMNIDEISQGLTEEISPESILELKKKVEKHIKNEVGETVDLCLKGHHSDVFQIGRMVSIRDYTFYDSIKKNYREITPFIESKIDVECSLKRVDNEIINRR